MLGCGLGSACCFWILSSLGSGGLGFFGGCSRRSRLYWGGWWLVGVGVAGARIGMSFEG